MTAPVERSASLATPSMVTLFSTPLSTVMFNATLNDVLASV